MELKNFEELTLADRFIFFKVMQNPDLCKQLLEIILGIEIEHIEYVEGEKNIEVSYRGKSIRLDVYVRDGEGTVYNVEMQAAATSHLSKRSRYYQSMIDLEQLGKGAKYARLGKSFVIFICLSDIFHKGRHIYTFENRCIEDMRLTLDDGTKKIFLNPHSDMDDVTPELANFLKYLANGVAVDDFTERLVKAVETAKRNPRLMVEYMSYYADLDDIEMEREEALKQEREEALSVLVTTLKSILPDFESVYNAVVKNEKYADRTRDEIKKYYYNPQGKYEI